MSSSASMTRSRDWPTMIVVVLNWNGGDLVCATIESALASVPSPAGIILVDNGSTDGSDLVVEHQFPTVTVIRNGINLGFAAGTNIGIRYALENGADGVLLLNNDAVLADSALTTMCSALLAEPRRGVVVPKIYARAPGQSDRLWAAGAKWHSFPPRVKMRGFNEPDTGKYDKPGPVEYATGCALLITRETFEIAGLLDESYFMYQEDYAFCDRVRARGLSIWYEPRALVYHRVSASSGEGSPRKWRYWSEGLGRFYVQHYGSRSQAIIPLTTFLLWVIMRELFKGRSDWIRPVWQGFRAGLFSM